ncbi:unnamed protein product, partial [Brenthis ino]
MFACGLFLISSNNRVSRLNEQLRFACPCGWDADWASIKSALVSKSCCVMTYEYSHVSRQESRPLVDLLNIKDVQVAD